MFSKKRLSLGMKHYCATFTLVWIAILFYRYNKYYAGFLMPETQTTLIVLALLYSVFGLAYYIVAPIEESHQTKGLILIRALRRLGKDFYHYLRHFDKDPSHPVPKIDHHEKTAMLFMAVKIIFLPLMLNFFYANLQNLRVHYGDIAAPGTVLNIPLFNNLIFPFAISLIFFIDTAYFCFGYAVEAGFLNNTVRSVEPTVLGWAVALASYPPFNSLFGNYVSWYANDMATFPTQTITFVMRIIIIFLFLIYLSATLALGTKCSNLTNRGIVARGPYAVIRHPAYISKNLAWWVTVIPVLSIPAFLSMLAWSSIYYLRAITEERHLIRDPEYHAYCKKVKYRFIPFVW